MTERTTADVLSDAEEALRLSHKYRGSNQTDLELSFLRAAVRELITVLKDVAPKPPRKSLIASSSPLPPKPR